MRRPPSSVRIIGAALVTLVLLVPSAASSAALPAPQTFQDQILSQSSAVRVAKGTTKLSLNSCLDNYANAWATKLAAEQRLVHRSTASLKLIMGADRCNLKMIGENLATGQASGSGVVGAASHSPSDSCLKASGSDRCSINWMRSSGHRANLLGTSYRRTGVGAALGSDGRMYSVQLYGAPR